MRIGFPRAVFYYDYYPFWAGFFDNLNIDISITPPTNRKIMEVGLKKASEDTCLPIKLLVGHLQSMEDVDAVFLPRLVSMEEDTYICPKFLGLPESVTSAIPENLPLLTVTINWRSGKRQVLKALEAFGTELGKNKKEIAIAFQEALKWQKIYEEYRRQGWGFQESIDRCSALLNPEKTGSRVYKTDDRSKSKVISQSISDKEQKRPVIALIGHSYLTNESYANLNLLKKLKSKAKVHVVENVEVPAIEFNLKGLRKKIFWSHSKKIYGAGSSFVVDPKIDGLIYLSCFGCGTDSMTQDMLARRAKEGHKPYMVLTLDEHSGEAGLVTRLEAFIDMIERRMSHEGDLSTYGERVDNN